jgi:two-component system, sensor histidine kinase RegB
MTLAVFEEPSSPVHVHWLVRLRWAAVCAMVASLLAVRYVLRAPFPQVPVALILGGLVVANVMLMRALSRAPTLRPRVIAAHLLVDTAALTGLLVWTGGAMNPFTTLYLLHVALAAVLVSRRWSLAVALAAVLLFGALLLLKPEAVHVWHAPGMFMLHVRGMWFAFALTAGCLWYFIHRVTDSLDQRDRELAAARLDAERAQRLVALGTLAAGTAHELNTPLGTVAILASELSDQLSDRPDAQSQADKIRIEVKRCTAILSRLRAHEHEPEDPQTLEITSWLEEVVEGFCTLHKGLKIPVRASATARQTTVRIRSEALRQAVYNLLDNARLATAKIHGKDLVRVDLDVSDKMLTLTVEDRGVGIAPELMTHVGEPFFTTRDQGEGTGLGLYLVRATAAQHGGGFVLTSESTQTRATISLPLM